MLQPEEQIFRLNKRIKELIAIYEKTLTQNVQLDSDNERLSTALAHSDEQMKRVHHLNVQYKNDLDKLIVDRDQQQKIQHGLKTKLNETMSMCRDQNNEIATLKRSLQTQRAISMAPGRAGSQLPQQAVTVDVPDRELEDECKRLRAEVKQLEDELQESYDLIDDLEFEVEQIGYLESENERLQEELSIISSASTVDRNHTDSGVVVDNLVHAETLPVVGVVGIDDDADDEHVAGGEDVVDKQAPTGSSDEHDALQQRRDLLHRKLETLQQRQTRRSDNLTEKFQRGLSVRRQ